MLKGLVVKPLKSAGEVAVSEEAKSIVRAKAEHIRKHVPIMRFLADLGYEVDPQSPEDQQFRCDLHGGEDRKPSAKAYIASSSWYCWACHKARDHISTLREKIPSLSFAEAYDRIAREYGVPKFKAGLYGVETLTQASSEEEYTQEEILQVRTMEEFEREKERLGRLMEILTAERSFTLKQATRLWASFDAVCWHIDNQEWSPSKGTSYLGKMRFKVMNLLESQHGRQEGEHSA